MFFYFPPWLRHGRPNQASSVFSLDIQPDGTRLATAGQDCTVKLWNVPTLAAHARRYHAHPSAPAAPGPDPAASQPPAPPDGALLATLSIHSAAVNVVRWAPTADLLASAGDDHVVLLYTRVATRALSAFAAASGAGVETWEARRPLRAHASDVTDLAWSPDAERLASASVDNSIIVWNLRTHAVHVRLDGHRGLVKGVAWDPVGRFVASQSDDRTVRIWRTADWKLDKVISKPFETAVYVENSMTFFLRIGWSPCGTQLVATNAYRRPGTHHAPLFSRAREFDVAIEFVGHRDPVISTRFSPRLYRPHPHMLKKGDDANDKPAGGPAAANGTGEAGANGKASSADDAKKDATAKNATYTILALGSKDGGCSVWQATKSRPFFEMANVFDMEVIDLSWGTDGYSLAACSTDGKVLYIRFEPEELGLVVPHEEARATLTEVWRSLGGTTEDARPLPESAEQLAMESQKGRKNGAFPCAAPSSPGPGSAPRSNAPPATLPATSAAQQIAPDSAAAAPKPPLPSATSAPPPPAPAQTPGSPPPDRMDDRDTSIPEPVRAAAEAARQNGPTPPADPRLMAAQAETRVRGGKRRIVPVSVSSDAAPSGLDAGAGTSAGPDVPPMQSAAPLGMGRQPAPLEISETVIEPSAPFKRPRTGGQPAEATIAPFVRNAIAEREGVSNGAPSTMPAGTANGVQPYARAPDLVAGTPVPHTAPVYAPSVAGLSLMLLPDRGDGPGRVRVIGDGDARVVLESREQHAGAGGYVVVCSVGGKVKWRDYHPKSSAVTALAGVVDKHVAVGTADGMLYLHAATSGRRLLPPIALDSAPYMLESVCVTADGAEVRQRNADDMEDDGADAADELWFVVVVSRSALVSVFDVKAKRLVCARSAASLLARPFDTEVDGKDEAAGAKARVFREISQCRITALGEPILVLSDGHAFVYSRGLCSWLRVADDSSPNSEYKRTAPSSKRVGLLRSLQSGMGIRNKPLPTLSGMGDLRRAAVESLAHLESLMESAVVLGSATDYRYYLSNYATRISAAVSDDVESCILRLREVCDFLLNAEGGAADRRIVGLSGRELLRDTVLPVVSENRNMQRIVTEYVESLALVERSGRKGAAASTSGDATN